MKEDQDQQKILLILKI